MRDSLDAQTIREHYDRIRPVLEQLAEVDGHLTIGLNDNDGWYVRRDLHQVGLIEEGFDQEGRCATLAKDYDKVTGRIERCLYALTSYKSRESLLDWEPCTISDGRTEWREEKPTPGYGDLRAVMAWGDIDLDDDLKPQRGDLDEDTHSLVEETLEAYIDEFAELYGDREAIFALDSVGGAYVMGAPACTLPIADLFEDDQDALTRVMEEFVDRSNEWLKRAQTRVEERIDGAADVIDPDWVNNCNRQYKAPLSLHKRHDAVTVPLHVDSPTYQMVAFEDVDDELVEDTKSWALDLTSTKYREHAAHLVEQLWPEEIEDADSWESALESWVEAERRREKQEEEARRRARERRRKRKEQMGSGLEGSPVTPFISDVFDALDHLDVEAVADRTIVHQWTDQATGMEDNSGSGKRAFVPIWGPDAESGNANFVDTERGIWVDTGDDHTGGPVKMALIDLEGWNRGDTPSGEDWRRGVEHLRDLGFEIPVWCPDARSQSQDGDEYEKMPYWSVRKAAVALGVLPEDAFIRAESDEGGYLRFPGAETYNHALAAIEDAGLEHGREYMTTGGERPAEVDQGDRGDDGENSSFTAYSALDEHDGKYGYWRENQETGETYFDAKTNFTIEANSYLFKEDERLFDMTVIPQSQEAEYDVTVPAKVFNEPRRFRDNVLTGLTLTFDGGQRDLNELRKLVGSQDAPVRVGTDHMGIHPDAGEFVAPTGVLSADGWKEDPQMAYIPRETSIEQAWSLTPDQHGDYDPKAVAEMLELLPRSRFTDRFLPVLGWMYSSALRPYVQEWEGQFNSLHVSGDTGVGKSSTLSLCWRLMGMDGEPMTFDQSKFAMLVTLSSTHSIPIFYDEYKPSDLPDWKINHFQNLLRTTTRGGIDSRGRPDLSTETYRLKAPLMISGEQAIQGPAEERRSIQIRFREGVKEPGSPTKIAFSELTGMPYRKGGETYDPSGYRLEDHALAYYRFVLSKEETELKDQWMDARERIRQLLSDHEITGVDDLPRQGLQTVYFGLMVQRDFAHSMADEANIDAGDLDLPTDEEIEDALLYIAEQFGDDGRRKSHLDQFMELATRAANEQYLEQGSHFVFVREGEHDEELALKLSSAHDRISKYVRDHGLTSEDLLNNSEDYRERMSEAADDPTSYVISHSQKSPPLARCARINTRVAEEQTEFSRQAFGAPPREDEEGEESTRGDDDGGHGPSVYGARQLADVADDATGYANVTVEVLTLDRPSKDDLPAMKATVKDTTTAMDVVSWNDPHAIPDGGYFLIKNAQVGKHRGRVQLTIREGVTEVTEIQPGVGHTDPVEGDQEQAALPDADTQGVKAASDGGTSTPHAGADLDVPDDAEGMRADADRAAQVLESLGSSASRSELIVELTARRGLMDPERAKKAIEVAITKVGSIIDDGDELRRA